MDYKAGFEVNKRIFNLNKEDLTKSAKVATALGELFQVIAEKLKVRQEYGEFLDE